jgi:hypothetical protein
MYNGKAKSGGMQIKDGKTNKIKEVWVLEEISNLFSVLLPV